MQVSREELLPNAPSYDALLGSEHIFVAAPSGSGKTVLLRHFWRQTTHTRIFVNAEEESMPNAKVARSPREVKLLVAEGCKAIDFRVSPQIKVMEKQIEEMRRELFQIGDLIRQGKDKTDTWCVVFFDEAQLYSPKHDKDGALPDYLRRGRKRGLRAIVSTNEPAGVSHTALKQCQVKCLFGFTPFEMEYFRNYAVPVDEFQHHIEMPHHWVMTKGNKWVAYKPVPFQ